MICILQEKLSDTLKSKIINNKIVRNFKKNFMYTVNLIFTVICKF